MMLPDAEIFDVVTTTASLFANVFGVLKDNIGAIVATMGFMIGISMVMSLMDMNREAKWLDHEKRHWAAKNGWITRRFKSRGQ